MDGIAGNFSETRFGGLVAFLSEQTARLADEYRVTDDRLSEVQAIEDRVRQMNQSRWGE